jgi:hypothetical protein
MSMEQDEEVESEEEKASSTASVTEKAQIRCLMVSSGECPGLRK